MSPDGQPPLLASLAIVVAAYLLLFALGEVLRALGLTGAATRRVVHVGSAIPAAALPWLFDSPLPVVVLAAGFVVVLLTSARIGLLGSIHDIGRPSAGAVLYPVAVAAVFSLAPGLTEYLIAVAALGLGDPAAGYVGERLGHHRFVSWGARRSVEGSLVAAAVTALVATGVLIVSDAPGLAPPAALALALGAGAAASLAEAGSPLGIDNLTMPGAALLAAVLPAVAVLAVVALLATWVTVGIAWSRSRRPLAPATAARPLPAGEGPR
jgi:dolichol kinase